MAGFVALFFSILVSFLVIDFSTSQLDFAFPEFYNSIGFNLPRNSSPPSFAAIDVIQDQKLQAILGGLTCQEAVLVAATNKVSILSLTPATSLTMPKNELPVINMFDDLSVRISLILAVIKNYKLAATPALQMVNAGKRYREGGFQFQEHNFTTKPVGNSNGKGKNLKVEEALGTVLWAGGTTSLPFCGFSIRVFEASVRYLQYPLIDNWVPFYGSYDALEEEVYLNTFNAAVGDTLITANRYQYVEFSQPYTESSLVRIAVPASSMFTQFMKVIRDVNHNITYIGGFSVRVFEAAVRYLQYPLIYNLVPFYGSYDAMVKEVSLNNFDAAIGDVLITANRNQPVDFSQPYIESNLVMVVPEQKPEQEFWMFLKPFSKGMWLLMAAMVVSTGFVVWSLEHRINSDFHGPPDRPIGTSLWFAFSTVVFAHRESIRSEWTRFVLAPWLFLILIITSTYTANFSSMLTNPQLEPSKTDIHSLKTTNAIVGCDGNSFIFWYLKEVLGFKADNIKNVTSMDDFANSLSRAHIKAAFMLSPHARVFVSEHCQRLTISGPTFKLSGFGYVFPKGSSLASDISEAIIYLKQSGELQQLEEEKLSYSKCSTLASHTGSESLGIGPFAGLFIISGSVSAVGLIVAVIRQMRKHWEEFTFLKTMWLCRGLWLWIAAFLTPNKAKAEIELSIESCDPPEELVKG